MFKIFRPSDDELVLISIPFQSYVGAAILLISGGLLVFTGEEIFSHKRIAGIILMLIGLSLACLGIHQKKLILQRKLQIMYVIRKSLFRKSIKKYYFYEIKRFLVQVPTALIPDQAKQPQKKIRQKCRVLMQKVSGRYKVLFQDKDIFRLQQAVNLLEDFISLA
ncbi:MAG: hypothetical protein K6T34_04295 [Thermoflavifilum sp.]|nr:hypothetical protein [Thermoflavifilum sp.]